jgi:hypothetical protein
MSSVTKSSKRIFFLEDSDELEKKRKREAGSPSPGLR